MVIRTESQTVEFHASNAWDPIPDLIGWLLRIARGNLPELRIDTEGDFWLFRLSQANRLGSFTIARRILLENQWKTDTVLQMEIGRRELIRSFYIPLLRLWESAPFRDAWREWNFRAEDPDTPQNERTPYPIRSSELDAIANAP